MDISKEQIKSRKVIGKSGRHSVYEIITKGGFHVVAIAKDKPEVVGTGPNRCIARHIAAQKCKDLVITELSKSDWEDPEHFQDLIPKYTAWTDRLNAALNK